MTDLRSPNRPEILLRPIGEADPRTLIEGRDLILASRNAYPVVARAPRRSDGLGLAAGAGFAVLLGGITFWSMSGHRTAPPPPPPAAIVAPAPVASAPQPIPMPRPAAPAPFVLPATSQLGAPLVQPSADPRRSPAMVFDGSAATIPLAAPTAEATKPGAKPATPAGGGENDQFASRASGERADVATAESLSNPAFTVTQGTLIPAVLETAIDTDLPGFVRAVVSQDVRSFDGKTVLIPRSSRVIGQYKSGLQAGQTRAYVIWQRLIRPDGVSVALGSPAVDFSGRTGLAGKVDGHFMKRFGSAALLSVIGGLGALGSSGTSVILSGGGQSAASVAAGRDSAIPPTIRVPQGQPIRIFTARDLDFSPTGAG